MAIGIVKWFSPEKQFGFIAADEGGDVFVHRRQVERGGSGPALLAEGERVQFEIEATPKGPRAVGVRVVDGAR